MYLKEKLIRMAFLPFIGKGYGEKYPFLRNLYSRIAKKGLMQTEVNGYKMYLDLKDTMVSQEVFYKGVWEKELTKLMKDIIKEDTVFVDVGAHIGYYSLLAAKIAKKSRVYSFEPMTINYELLEKNIALNNYKNVKCFKIALSDSEGKVKLYCDKNLSVRNSIVSTEIIEGNALEDVETMPLDFLVENADIVKIDVEGGEVKVLKGMKKLIEINQDIIVIIEYIPNYYKNPMELIDLLRSFNFKLWIVDWNKELEQSDLDRVILKSREGQIAGFNLLCRKRVREIDKR